METAPTTASVNLSFPVRRVDLSVRKGHFHPVPGAAAVKESSCVWDWPLDIAVYLIPQVSNRNNTLSISAWK